MAARVYTPASYYLLERILASRCPMKQEFWRDDAGLCRSKGFRAVKIMPQTRLQVTFEQQLCI